MSATSGVVNSGSIGPSAAKPEAEPQNCFVGLGPNSGLGPQIPEARLLRVPTRLLSRTSAPVPALASEAARRDAFGSESPPSLGEAELRGEAYPSRSLETRSQSQLSKDDGSRYECDSLLTRSGRCCSHGRVPGRLYFQVSRVWDPNPRRRFLKDCAPLLSVVWHRIASITEG